MRPKPSEITNQFIYQLPARPCWKKDRCAERRGQDWGAAYDDVDLSLIDIIGPQIATALERRMARTRQ